MSIVLLAAVGGGRARVYKNRRLKFKKSARKSLDRVQPTGVRHKIENYFERLKTSPLAGDLETVDDGHRLRVGGYRAIFDLEDYDTADEQGFTGLISVRKIGPRGGVYKGKKGG